MPRPHSLPRRPPREPRDVFPPFEPVPPTRVLTSINVRRDEKAIFDALQSWLSYREGRALQHWEVFGLVLEAALTGDASRLGGFRLPRPPSP